MIKYFTIEDLLKHYLQKKFHILEQVVDYVVENGYINNVLDLMKTPFDRPYKYSLIFTYEEQVKFVKIINNIKNNALVT